MTASLKNQGDPGRRRLVRCGFLPEREVMTGVGKVAVQVPLIRDRGECNETDRIRYILQMSRDGISFRSSWAAAIRSTAAEWDRLRLDREF